MTSPVRDACPVCGAPLLLPFDMPRLSVRRCRDCGHRVATHRADATTSKDYHQQYDEGAFLEALTTTRLRQARLIVDALRQSMPDCDGVLDFGAGRGWFLDVCRHSGMRELAAADTSRLAVSAAQGKGYVGLLVGDNVAPLDPDAVPFAPRVLTLLDVIEHFRADELEARINSLLTALPSVELVVVKVPVSSGPLYALAGLLAHLGLGGALEQLYQVGTAPPHRSYFSRASLLLLLQRCGLRPIRLIGDLDFEPRLLLDRVHALGGLPAAVRTTISRPFGAGCRVLPTRDSLIAVCVRVDESAT